MAETNLLTPEKLSPYEIVSISTDRRSPDSLSDKEYLLTNTTGGYCCSTVIGCNTRRYHGLLTGSLNPPANRILALSNLLETINTNGQSYNLSTFQFDETFHPEGFTYLKNFKRDIGAHFDYKINSIEITKSIYLARNTDTVLIEYDFKKIDLPLEFTIRPFAALRDFHSLQKSNAVFNFNRTEDCILIENNSSDNGRLLINCPDGFFEQDTQWWYNFTYQKDRQRCQDYLEDLWSPGFYRVIINPSQSAAKVVFKAQFGSNNQPAQLKAATTKSIISELEKAYDTIITSACADNQTKKQLVIAADAFICRRGTDNSATILAGYPWFFDWGRDAFISIGGLLLKTKRYNDAKSVLTTFASAVDQGMIPNRFDDRAGSAHYNSIDASLWFINAAFEYLRETNDKKTFNNTLLGAIEEIIAGYKKGTRFGIHSDTDGLITAGDINTQLTWMDSKCNGIAFTPRYGKAVEVNALWYNAMRKLAKYYENLNPEKAAELNTFAVKIADSFNNAFVNEQTGYLNDCLSPDGSADTSCRPNQIFAVSLEFSPLSIEWQKKVVDIVQQKLLTPFGLRTLDRNAPGYRGTYIGDQFSRDSAYHQGTVWPYLLGAFIQAYLKVNNYNSQSKAKAKEFLEPLIEHMTQAGCLGGISEIFDGDEPHKHRGCITQAWSIAEILRVFSLINP